MVDCGHGSPGQFTDFRRTYGVTICTHKMLRFARFVGNHGELTRDRGFQSYTTMTALDYFCSTRINQSNILLLSVTVKRSKMEQNCEEKNRIQR